MLQPKSKSFLILLFLLFSFIKVNKGQQDDDLTAVDLSATLPCPLLNPRAFYDGFDLVYIFGRCYNDAGSPDQIVSYSVSTGTVKRLSCSLPGRGGLGSSVQMDTDGNLYYFGGESEQNHFNLIYKIDLVRNSSSVVTSLPYDIEGHTSFRGKNEEGL